MYRVEIKGLKELQEALERSPEIVQGEMEKAMKKSVIMVTNNVKRNTPTGVTGYLKKSIGYEVETPTNRIRGRVGTSITEVYPIVVELGRNPGEKPPPRERLKPWIRRKMKIRSEKLLEKKAKDLAVAIGFYGTKPAEMFKKGWETSVNDVQKYFDKALLEIVKKLGD